MSVVGGGGGWQQLMALLCGLGLVVVGGRGEKLQFFAPNELRSPKTTCLKKYFSIKGGGWLGQILNRKFY